MRQNVSPLFSLPELPYPTDALEPYIDRTTVEIHHGKHHATYVANLNKALAQTTIPEGKSIEWVCRNLPLIDENVRTAVRNNGGSHYNHSLFWEICAPAAMQTPSGPLAEAIDASFGSFDSFKQAFTDAAIKQFGSGWAWLSVADNRLNITSTPNQDNPLMQGSTPILCIDVWEHAYYLKYQNRRPEFVANWWNLVNWSKVSELFLQAR